jgi:hypothetical protein
MTSLSSTQRDLLSRYADGEASADQVREAEALLESEPAAIDYLEALREVGEAVRLPMQAAERAVSFDGLLDRVMSAVAATEPSPLPARDAELEMLAMAMADGELSSPADAARARGYVARTPEARAGLESLATMGALVRAVHERAEQRVDFEALARRVERATARVDEERATSANRAVAAPSRSLLLVVLDFIGGPRTLVASGLSAAAVALVMWPLVRQAPTEVPGVAQPEPTVVNNYYLTPASVESVDFQPGFWGSYQAGDPSQDLAPVVWIAPEEGSSARSTQGLEIEYDPAAGLPVGKPL